MVSVRGFEHVNGVAHYFCCDCQVSFSCHLQIEMVACMGSRMVLEEDTHYSNTHKQTRSVSNSLIDILNGSKSQKIGSEDRLSGLNRVEFEIIQEKQ